MARRKNTTIAITRELYDYLTKHQKKLSEERGRYVPYSDVIAFLIGKRMSDIADSYKKEQERVVKEREKLEMEREKLEKERERLERLKKEIEEVKTTTKLKAMFKRLGLSWEEWGKGK